MKKLFIALLIGAFITLFIGCSPKYGCPATKGKVGYGNYKK